MSSGGAAGRHGLAIPVVGSVALHLAAAVAAALAARGPARPPMPPVYQVELVAAPPGPRAPSSPASLPAAAPTPVPPAAAAVPPAPMPPAPVPPAAAPARAVPAARPSPLPVPPPSDPPLRAPLATRPLPGAEPARPAPSTPAAPAAPAAPATPSGGGATGDRGTDVVSVRTAGIEFPHPGYLRNVVRQIALNFRPDGPGAALRAEVAFTIRRDGSVADIRIVTRSGDFAFDLEAQGAVEAAGRRRAFGPLPAAYPSDALPVVFSFDPRVLRQE